MPVVGPDAEMRELAPPPPRGGGPSAATVGHIVGGVAVLLMLAALCLCAACYVRTVRRHTPTGGKVSGSANGARLGSPAEDACSDGQLPLLRGPAGGAKSKEHEECRTYHRGEHVVVRLPSGSRSVALEICDAAGRVYRTPSAALAAPATSGATHRYAARPPSMSLAAQRRPRSVEPSGSAPPRAHARSASAGPSGARARRDADTMTTTGRLHCPAAGGAQVEVLTHEGRAAWVASSFLADSQRTVSEALDRSFGFGSNNSGQPLLLDRPATSSAQHVASASASPERRSAHAPAVDVGGSSLMSGDAPPQLNGIRGHVRDSVDGATVAPRRGRRRRPRSCMPLLESPLQPHRHAANADVALNTGAAPFGLQRAPPPRGDALGARGRRAAEASRPRVATRASGSALSASSSSVPLPAGRAPLRRVSAGGFRDFDLCMTAPARRLTPRPHTTTALPLAALVRPRRRASSDSRAHSSPATTRAPPDTPAAASPLTDASTTHEPWRPSCSLASSRPFAAPFTRSSLTDGDLLASYGLPMELLTTRRDDAEAATSALMDTLSLPPPDWDRPSGASDAERSGMLRAQYLPRDVVPAARWAVYDAARVLQRGAPETPKARKGRLRSFQCIDVAAQDVPSREAPTGAYGHQDAAAQDAPPRAAPAGAYGQQSESEASIALRMPPAAALPPPRAPLSTLHEPLSTLHEPLSPLREPGTTGDTPPPPPPARTQPSSRAGLRSCSRQRPSGRNVDVLFVTGAHTTRQRLQRLRADPAPAPPPRRAARPQSDCSPVRALRVNLPRAPQRPISSPLHTVSPPAPPAPPRPLLTSDTLGPADDDAAHADAGARSGAALPANRRFSGAAVPLNAAMLAAMAPSERLVCELERMAAAGGARAQFARSYELLNERVTGGQSVVNFARLRCALRYSAARTHCWRHGTCWLFALFLLCGGGPPGHVRRQGGMAQCAIKFFDSRDEFKAEVALYAKPALRNTLPPLLWANGNEDAAVCSPTCALVATSMFFSPTSLYKKNSRLLVARRPRPAC